MFRARTASDLRRPDLMVMHAVRPCVLFPASFTNPLALETGDLVTHRNRGSEDSAPFTHRILRIIQPFRASVF